MDLNKSKYKKSEVEELIFNVRKEYEDRLLEDKSQIEELIKENKEKSAMLDEYKSKDALINSAIKSAKEKAEEIDRTAKLKYSMEIENLKVFCARFNSYFSYLVEKYPLYPAVLEAKKVYDKLNSTINEKDVDGQDVVGKVGKLFGKGNTVKTPDGKVFNPQEKINEYIAATGDNGFNLDEVLNPGNLELEDLCKELGLIEE